MTCTIVLQPTPDQGDLIARAARVVGVTPEDFVLHTACQSAEDIILDQLHFVLGAEEFQRFCAALDSPPELNPGLARLLAVRPPSGGGSPP
jgi:uncharacterized protein (DUF1778 family)